MTRGQRGNVDMLRVSAVRGSRGEAASDKGHGSGGVRWAGKAQGTKKEPTSSGNGKARGRGAKRRYWVDMVSRGHSWTRRGTSAAQRRGQRRHTTEEECVDSVHLGDGKGQELDVHKAGTGRSQLEYTTAARTEGQRRRAAYVEPALREEGNRSW
ncbi:hypothetical protein ERJ75_000654300 [Trypanosoma vivax]|nr:hypothetical protein ERJ75_000654300 [Trypanosoma vivax]